MSSSVKCFFVFLVFFAFIFGGCNNYGDSKKTKEELIIFHAGSMSVPLHELAKKFEKINPTVDIKLEAAGSVTCVKKVTDLERYCDILVSADYRIIDELLIPDYASYNIWFTVNEMVLVFNENSKYADIINSENWYEILLRDDVLYGRSDPDSDPCGYRSVISIKLAEEVYNRPGLSDKLIAKNNEYIRPKASDLLALLEVNVVDYVFEYKTVAKQHNLGFITLPDSVNLKMTDLEEWYATQSIDIVGKKPGEYLNIHGESIVYGLTILDDSEHIKLAEIFVLFMLNDPEGREILSNNSHQILEPVICSPTHEKPEFLKKE